MNDGNKIIPLMIYGTHAGWTTVGEQKKAIELSKSIKQKMDKAFMDHLDKFMFKSPSTSVANTEKSSQF